MDVPRNFQNKDEIRMQEPVGESFALIYTLNVDL